MWEPIIDGPDTKRVWSAIEAIVDPLAELTYPAADLAVLWTYLATVRDDFAGQAELASGRFMAELARGYVRPALFDGLAGGGWAAAHIGTDIDDLLASIDSRLIAQLEHWVGGYDLISGLAGLGVYFLEHEGPAAARGRELVVEKLRAASEGGTWFTRAEQLPDRQRAEWPDGYYNCGVAHGVPGAIGVLARIAARPDAPPDAAALCADARRWLATRRDASVVLGDRRDPARTAWCYGAPGIAVALQDPEPSWLASESGVAEAGFCHGSSGLMHIANRCYQATRDLRYRDAARRWLERTLAYGTTGLPTDVRSASLLLGRTGVALALLAAVSDLEPSWDRLLVCDLSGGDPPRLPSAR